MTEGNSQTVRPGEKSWDAAIYDQKHSFVWKFGAAVIELLAPRKGERILDLGCGTGHLTHQIALSGAEVIGLDRSADMIEQARKNYPEVRFVLADAADFEFPLPFDAVFSNAALHWMKEQARVTACIARALKSGGRFVAEFGGKGNLQAIRRAIPRALEEMRIPIEGDWWNPWYYPTIGEYASLLERHGLAVRSALLFDRPTALEDGARGLRTWIEMFRSDLLASLPPDTLPDFLDRMERHLRPVLFRDGVWYADYQRIRVVAVRE